MATTSSLGNDILKGTNTPNVIWASRGDDSVYGMSGNDRLYGEHGADRISGGEGNDRIGGGMGADKLYGDKGEDTLFGDFAKDFLWGGDGKDKLFGGQGDDTLLGANGDDALYGNEGYDVLDGGAGNDQLDGSTDVDTLRGGDGDDLLYLHDGDVGFGGTGDDDIQMDGYGVVASGNQGADRFSAYLDQNRGGGDMVITDFNVFEDSLTIRWDSEEGVTGFDPLSNPSWQPDVTWTKDENGWVEFDLSLASDDLGGTVTLVGVTELPNPAITLG